MGSRSKPAVAEHNRSVARQNIKEKLRTIEAVLDREKPPVAALKTLPTSLRQFNQWSARPSSIAPGFPDVELRSNGPQTLRGMSEEAAEAESLVSRVRSEFLNLKKRSREVRLSRLQERLNLSEKLRQIAERTVASLVDQLEVSQAEVRRVTAELNSTVQEAAHELQEVEADLLLERKRVSELTQTLRKTVRLGKVK